MDFERIPSSPYYPQTNGLAEASVKTEFLKGLLSLRNAPLKCGQSPAQLMFGRQLRDDLRTTSDRLRERILPQRNLFEERVQAKRYYDKKNTKIIVENFYEKQRVRVKDMRSGEWTIEGTIRKQVAPNAYDVEIKSGRVIRRNKRDIRKIWYIHLQSGKVVTYNDDTLDITIPYGMIDEREEHTTETIQNNENLEDTIPYDIEENSYRNETVNKTRSGRTIKKRTILDL